MPRIEDFKVKLKEFKPTKYTPWDSSPTPQDEILSQMVEPLLNNTKIHTKDPIETSTKNQVQNEFKTDFKQVQNETDLGSKLMLKRVQNGFKTDLKTGFESGSKPVGLNKNRELQKPEDLSLLTGAQKKIFLYLVDICYKDNGSILVNTNTTELSKLLCIPKDTVKTSIRRLQEKFLLKKKTSKQGVGGFLRFEISEEIKLKCLEIQKNDLLNMFKNGSETGSKTGFSSTVVSSSNINTTTTSNENLLPSEWEQIDCSSLEHIGFSKSHLIQIHRELIRKPELMLSADIIQDSINALSFDLKHNSVSNAFKNPPTVVLTSLLKKGSPYVSKTPDQFLSPHDEAMKNYLENKKQKMKIQEEQEQLLREVEFIEWYDSLSEQQTIGFLGEKVKNIVGSELMKEKVIKGWLSQHFDEEIWPLKRKKIIAEILMKQE